MQNNLRTDYHKGRDPLSVQDKLHSALILGILIWSVDHLLTWFSGKLSDFSLGQQAIILTTFPVIAIISSFFISKRLFSSFSWAFTEHALGDRVVTVLLGVILQLAFDVVFLRWVSPGKLLMTFLYAVSAGFGAIAAPKSKSVASGETRSTELVSQRVKARVVSISLLICYIVFRLLLLQPSVLFSRTGGYFVIALLGVVICSLLLSYLNTRLLK